MTVCGFLTIRSVLECQQLYCWLPGNITVKPKVQEGTTLCSDCMIEILLKMLATPYGNISLKTSSAISSERLTLVFVVTRIVSAFGVFCFSYNIQSLSDWERCFIVTLGFEGFWCCSLLVCVELILTFHKSQAEELSYIDLYPQMNMFYTQSCDNYCFNHYTFSYNYISEVLAWCPFMAATCFLALVAPP